MELVSAVPGSIVVAYNLEGLEADLTLTREVYVVIFLGKIKAGTICASSA